MWNLQAEHHAIPETSGTQQHFNTMIATSGSRLAPAGRVRDGGRTGHHARNLPFASLGFMLSI